MNRPLLSICIPTYNRAHLLQECLASITGQFSNQEVAGLVEVVVSDNGSIDGTAEVMKRWQSDWPQLHYFRNSENIGFDRNVLAVVEKAQGEYCWLMGDDDALFEDSLAHLLPILQTGRFAYLLANTWGYDRNLKDQALSKPNLNLARDQSYLSLAEFVRSIASLQNLVGYFGGMSGQIFKRQVWQNFPQKDSFISTQVIHLYVILQAFKDLPTLVLTKPLVKTRADNLRWDTFPGLETVTKRQRRTSEGAKWILDLYQIPYSKTRLTVSYYFALGYGWLYFLGKKTFLRHEGTKRILKKFLGK